MQILGWVFLQGLWNFLWIRWFCQRRCWGGYPKFYGGRFTSSTSKFSCWFSFSRFSLFASSNFWRISCLYLDFWVLVVWTKLSCARYLYWFFLIFSFVEIESLTPSGILPSWIVSIYLEHLHLPTWSGPQLYSWYLKF